MTPNRKTIIELAARAGLSPAHDMYGLERFYAEVVAHLSANTTQASHAASPVATTADFRMRLDMPQAPLGQKLLLINEGGSLVPGILSRDTLSHFIEWQYCPKRALRPTPG